MATGQGTAIINFGTFPGTNEASVAVSAALISATSKAEAYIMGDDTTSDHTNIDHRLFNSLVGLTCGTPVAATGFTIYATSINSHVGTFNVRYVWAD